MLISSLLLPNLLFFYLRYEIRQEAKKEMKQSTNPLLINDFKFDNSEFKKLHFIHSKEFVYNGDMYDVISIAKKGLSTHIRCIIDHKEKAFLSNYINNHKDFRFLQLINIFNFLSFYLVNYNTIDNLTNYKNLKYEISYTLSIILQSFDIITPPPEIKY